MSQPAEQVITSVDLRDFFRQQVQGAVANQRLEVTDETILYLSNMLAVFMRSEELFEDTPEGRMIRPLAALYADALASESAGCRNRMLQKLGDVALFITGIYAESLGRSLVDVDYYAAMGGSAYGYLADSRSLRSCAALKEVFSELAHSFICLIDVLSEVGENTNISNNVDVLRLYEIWLSTGSARVAGRLQSLGIHPLKTSRIAH